MLLGIPTGKNALLNLLTSNQLTFIDMKMVVFIFFEQQFWI